MTERIPQSTSKLVVFKAFLSSDHVSEATSKTIAITISKNGGAFGNPNAGATNATEISSGWYKVSLDTTDTNTIGPLAVRGAVATIDDVGILLEVVKATNGGLTALPDTAVATNASLITAGTGTSQLSVTSGRALSDVDTIKTNPVVNAGTVTFPTTATLASTTNITAGTVTTATNVTTVNGLAAGVITSTSITDNAITAAKIANGAIDAATFAADVDAEILSYIVNDATRIDASSLNTLSGHDPGETIMGATDLGTGAGLTALATQASVDDLPTNAELATALAAADDAVLAAIGGLNDLSLADFFTSDSGETYADAISGSVVKEIADNAGGSSLTASDIADEVQTRTIAAVTDVVNTVSANITKVNNIAVNGSGTSGDPWGP